MSAMFPMEFWIPATLLLVALAFVAGAAWKRRRRHAKPRTVVFTRSWQKMGRDQIARQLAGWGETDPRWRALWDLYGEEFEAALLEVHSLPSTPEAMLEWKGRMQMMLHLRAQLLNLRNGKSDEELRY